MLAHFEHFYLLSLLVDLDWLHVSFGDKLNCNEVFGLDVSAKLDHAKLSFA